MMKGLSGSILEKNAIWTLASKDQVVDIQCVAIEPGALAFEIDDYIADVDSSKIRERHETAGLDSFEFYIPQNSPMSSSIADSEKRRSAVVVFGEDVG